MMILQFKKETIKLVLVALFCLFLSTTNKAQTPADDPGGPGSGSGGGSAGGDGSPIVPLDGGMSLFLLAAGVAYSAKKISVQEEKTEVIIG